MEKIRQRWKSIRDSYVKYINKTRDKVSSRVRPYKFERQLNFLKPFLSGGQKDGLMQYEDDSHSDDAPEPIVTVTPTHEDSPESNARSLLVSLAPVMITSETERSSVSFLSS